MAFDSQKNPLTWTGIHYLPNSCCLVSSISATNPPAPTSIIHTAGRMERTGTLAPVAEKRSPKIVLILASKFFTDAEGGDEE